MDLSGHSILIVETNITPFVGQLQAAIEPAGAESVVVRSRQAALERVKQFNFSAAAVNAEHRAIAEEPGIPYILHLPAEPPAVIVSGLTRLVTGS